MLGRCIFQEERSSLFSRAIMTSLSFPCQPRLQDFNTLSSCLSCSHGAVVKLRRRRGSSLPPTPPQSPRELWVCCRTSSQPQMGPHRHSLAMTGGSQQDHTPFPQLQPRAGCRRGAQGHTSPRAIGTFQRPRRHSLTGSRKTLFSCLEKSPPRARPAGD